MSDARVSTLRRWSLSRSLARQVYGFYNGTNITNANPTMTGFIKAYSQTTHIMDCFPPHKVPALTSLAMDFAVMNRYYGSVPGQTAPNRLYFFSATSEGSVNDDDARIAVGYPQRCIFQQIDESKYNRYERLPSCSLATATDRRDALASRAV